MASVPLVQVMTHALTIDAREARHRVEAMDGTHEDVQAARGLTAVLASEFESAVSALGGPHRPGEAPLLAAVRDYVHAICLGRVPDDLGAHRVDPGTPEGSLVGFLLCEAAMTSGQITLTESLTAEVLALVRPTDPMRTWARLVRSRALCFLGRLDEARSECETVLAESAHLPLTHTVARGVEGFIDGHAGRRSDLGRLCEQLREEMPAPTTYADGVVFLLAALAQSAAGSPTAAADVLQFGAGGRSMPLFPLVIRAYGYDVLVEAAVANARIVEARALLTAFDALPIDGQPMASAARERSRARVALASTQPSESAQAASSSAQLASDVGGELYVIRATILGALADAASGTGPSGRRALDELARTAALSGSSEVRAWALRELRGVGRGLRGFPGIGWDTLTPQQQVIARLAAQGLRNREIGRAMHLAEKTVESHVATILGALGATNRVGIGHTVAEPGSPAIGPVTMTARQREVAALLTAGLTNAAIAARLSISVKTVEKHVSHLFDAFGAHTRSAVAARFRAMDRDGLESGP